MPAARASSGCENLNEIEAAIERYDIDCDYERTGVIDVATTTTRRSYLDELRDDCRAAAPRSARTSSWLDARRRCSAEVDSPTYTGGLWRKDRAALVDPARLVWGLKAAAESLGVRIYEDTKATALEHGRRRRAGHDAARRASAPARSRSAPTPSSRCCGGMRPLHRAGLRLLHGHRAADAGAAGDHRLGATARACRDIPNQFHYYRLTEDNRILWGGYDAIYYWRRQGRRPSWRAGPRRGRSWPSTSSRPSRSSRACSSPTRGAGRSTRARRFCVFWGTAMQGRVAYALGYTGLGVAVDAVRRPR